MSATRDGNGDREERSRVIEFWRAVEIFSPQPLPRPDARMRITDAGPGEPMPWEPGSRHYAPSPPGKTWRHEVSGGVYELSRVKDTLTGPSGPVSDRPCSLARRISSSAARSSGVGSGFFFDATASSVAVITAHLPLNHTGLSDQCRKHL